MNSQTRKEFLVKTLLAGTALSSGIKSFSAFSNEESKKYFDQNPKHKASGTISIFSKNLQWLNYDEMATVAKELGFNGIDLTVRPNGHVTPERVEEDLPKAVAAIRKAGLDVYMMTTAISSAEEPYTERILKTASSLGIGYYRLNWFKYSAGEDITKDLEKFKTALKKLEQLNKKYNIHGAYQNHAGAYFGAPVWDIWMVINDMDPRWIGCQYDIRHATVEGGNSWQLGLQLLQLHIRSINIKDFYWAKKEDKWVEQNVPLGEGMVDFKKYIELLKTFHFNGPISVHYEYELGGAEDGAKKITMEKEKVMAAMRKDLTNLKTWLA